MMYRYFLKRIIDLISALLGLIILSPIFFILLILLIINNHGKPFFFQKRSGKREEIFKVIKFKTMNDKKDSKGILLPDKDRLTKLGVFVRETSLDEIPQLLNVLKGEMSLIGPRPLLPEYLSLYSKRQNKRHLVKPGITGLAQVNGRNEITWEEKFKYDIEYVDNCSFSLDIKIFFKTFLKVFKREGVSSNNHATMEKFTGNE